MRVAVPAHHVVRLVAPSVAPLDDDSDNLEPALRIRVEGEGLAGFRAQGAVSGFSAGVNVSRLQALGDDADQRPL